ncbi:MAG: alcohol dehydrogenase catalytic domain-containing protein [Polyangiales bacterium]
MTDPVQRVRIVETGWERDLEVERGPEQLPELEGDEVLVKVEACGVCYRDLIDRAGRIPFIQVPIVPGHEAAGRVVALGPEAKQWKVGDRVGSMHRNACGECEPCRAGHTSLCNTAAYVLGLLVDGGYARHLKMPESGFFPIPESLSGPEASVMHCTFGTAWRALVTVGGLKKGERVIVTGANGGVGAAGVQIAARFSDDVTAVVRDEKHEAFVRELGAHRVVVDTDGTFHKKAKGADLVLENVGAPTFNASLRSLKVGGRISVVGNVVEQRVELNLGYIVVNALKVLGPGGATRDDMAAVFQEHARKPFRVAIDRTMDLERADEAQRMVLRGGLHGRVVLIP